MIFQQNSIADIQKGVPNAGFLIPREKARFDAVLISRNGVKDCFLLKLIKECDKCPYSQLWHYFYASKGDGWLNVRIAQNVYHISVVTKRQQHTAVGTYYQSVVKMCRWSFFQDKCWLYDNH